MEKHFENMEKERIQKLQAERIDIIKEFVEDTTHLELHSMNDDVWNAYLLAKKQMYFDRIAAEKAQKEAEEAELQKQKEAEEMAKAPIKMQLLSWIDSFELPAVSTETEQSKNILLKFELFKKWAKGEVLK